LSLGFFIPVMGTFIQTGLVPNMPTLLMCGFTFIAAIVAFFTGLMLHTILQKNKQDFQLNLIRVDREKKDLLEKGLAVRRWRP